MEAIWYNKELSDEIMKNHDIFLETSNIVTDIISGNIDITVILENMVGVLTDKEPEHREKGMKFFNKLLKEMPKDFLTWIQLKYISKFYIDRLKENHRVIPRVIEGYLTIIDMTNYGIRNSGEYFRALFREVTCQSQVRQDRLHIYWTINNIFEKDVQYVKSLGPDFLYGFISAMDGERDPRNLLFLFEFLPKFLVNIPLGHLVEEMFEVISCYYPIDFHSKPNDPAQTTRDDLATALSPCLCAVPEFGEQCLVLLVEKLDSSLKLAKVDSLKLLVESLKNFETSSYAPFLNTLWVSIYREATQKGNYDLKMLAHETLSALIEKLATTANTDQMFENFIKSILITLQTAMADCNTGEQFFTVVKVLLTAANASKESCIIITKSMIPAVIAYYELKTNTKLQTASLDLLGDLYDVASHWEILNIIESEVHQIPQLCLTAASEPMIGYQITGLRTLTRVKDTLKVDLVVPFVEILIYIFQKSNNGELLKISVETIHAMAKKYPEVIMNVVVKGKCSLDNLNDNKVSIKKRLDLLLNLASLNDFTQLIIEEMLKLIKTDNEASEVVKSLTESFTNINIYTDEKVAQIESDHGLVDNIVAWLLKEINTGSDDSLLQGYELIQNTVSTLSPEKQAQILICHTEALLEKCNTDDSNYIILECLYHSIHQNVWNDHFEIIMNLSMKLALNSDNKVVRAKACYLIAHFLNKSEMGTRFDLLYELLKGFLSSCDKEDERLCARIICLYGWIAKALIMRGSELFKFWLQKITISIQNPECCKQGSDAIRIIMSGYAECLNIRQHCRTNPLYKQRMFLTFMNLMNAPDLPNEEIKEAYYLSWAYIIGETPKSVLINDINKVIPLIIDSLEYDNKDILVEMLGALGHFAHVRHALVAQSLQTLIPRLVKLSTYYKSMYVRMNSLQCLYEIAVAYQTMLLLPFKPDILWYLAPALDDRKRCVRNVAVKARTRWFLVGSPGEATNN